MYLRLAACLALVAVLRASSAHATSYLPGHYPGWTGPSAAERLVHAYAVVVATGTPGDSMRVDSVLSGTESLVGSTFSHSPGRPYVGWSYLVLVEQEKGCCATVATAPFDQPLTGGNDPVLEAARMVLRLRSADSLTGALMQAARTAPPSVSDLLQKVADDQAQTPSRYKPFAELKHLFDTAGTQRLRARVLDALEQRKERAGLPIARAVIESASELDVIPAAIRYVLSMRDKSAVPAIAKVYPTLAADQPPDSDSPDRIHRWLESGRAGSAASAVYALTVLAERADASLMKQVLRQARDGDASWLARYFLRYPDGEATANIRGRVAGRYSEKYNLAFALAALGDQGVVDWALERLDDPLPPPNDYNSLAWVPYYVIASSPLPEARKVTDELRSLGGLPRQWINEARTVSPAFMPE